MAILQGGSNQEALSEFSGTVQGVTSQGFLQVRAADTGEVVEVMPDGNSFDMMHGLVTIRRTREMAGGSCAPWRKNN